MELSRPTALCPGLDGKGREICPESSDAHSQRCCTPGAALEGGVATSYRSNERTKGGTRNGVLVLACGDRERPAIDVAISHSGATARWMDTFKPGELLSPCTSVILACLDGQGQRVPEESTDFCALRQKGFSIIACAAGVELWPIRDRCRFLLAGVSYLLDSNRQDFQDELVRLLVEHFGAETEKATEEQQAQATMASLGIVGTSRAMFAVFRTILRISVLSDVPTLVTGETGTGKELLAHAIHTLDPKRRKGPFVALNCAALVPTLAESELFGHRRGSFTGAERDRRGLICAANNGMLFLDEIGDLNLAVQAKLLRVLQENRVLRIGDEQELPVNVRVVAATNGDLREMVKQGTFRADLYYRLSVVSVRVPPLRERPDDIEPLIRAFVARQTRASRASQLAIAPEFIEALRQAELPGNVRQLENLVQQALVNKSEAAASLSLNDLPAELWLQLCLQQANGAMTDKIRTRPPSDVGFGTEEHWAKFLSAHGGNLACCLKSCERALFTTAFNRAQGNQSQMARLLGITPRSVYNKLNEYHLRTDRLGSI